jgi:hypothetical protein
MLVLICTGCSDGRPTGVVAPTPVQVAPRSGPTTPSGAFTVSGNVFEAVGGPIAVAPVDLWVQTTSFGYSYRWANGSLGTDDSGHYVAPNIPAARITLWATPPGYVQPCAVEADVDRDLNLNIEVMSEASLDISAQAPRSALGSLLSGSVFETTDEGRQPIRAAFVWAEFGGGITAATTKTDAQGRFIMCNLPRDTWLTIQKGGYVDASLRVPDRPATPLDVELRRR